MLKNLRTFMENEGITLFVVNSTDEYLSEYVSLDKNARYLITGFSGSTGDAIVTPHEVFLFVDGRYHLQAEKQTNPDVVTVVKVGMDKSPLKALYEKLAELATANVKIGIVSTKTSCSAFKEMQKALEDKQDVIIAEYEFDPVSPAQPPVDEKKLKYVPLAISGKITPQKMELVKKYTHDNNIDLLLITNLEEIAYLTNLRGKEIPYSSSFKAKAAVFWDKLHIFRTESKFDQFIKSVKAENVYFCPGSTTLSVYRKAEKASDKLVEIKDSFISELKSIKTAQELDYMQECYLKTDIVVNRTICWLNQNLEKGIKVSEKDLSDKVKNLFIEEGATGLSFETITASGDNTAFIHYTSPDAERAIKAGDLILLDCGAYFEYGYATDQTRTFLAGGMQATATDLQKHVYTAVLKAFLTGLNYEVKEDTTGFDIDKRVREVIEANKPEGFFFSHSTGHGVGIPVHEAPPKIGPTEASKILLKPNMCFTIEPGLYCEGKGGVRIENTVALINGKIKTLTRAGFDENLINYDMLSEQEKVWLQEYNRIKVG